MFARTHNHMGDEILISANGFILILLVAVMCQKCSTVPAKAEKKKTRLAMKTLILKCRFQN